MIPGGGGDSHDGIDRVLPVGSAEQLAGELADAHLRRASLLDTRSWTVSDQPGYPGCPYPITARVVGLQDANSFDVPSCPPPPTTAGYDAARPGLVVVAGRHVPRPPTDATCRTRAGLRVCVDPPPTSGGLQPGHELSLLTAQVYLPGQRRPDQIEIGLAGSGLQAAQIFDSIAPARAGSAAAGSRATVAQVHHFVTTLEPNDLRGHLVGDRLHPDRARTCNRDRRRPARQMVLPGHPGRRLPGGHRPRTRGRVFDQELRRVRRPRVRELR